MSHYDCMSCGVGPFTPHLKSCSKNKPVKSKKCKRKVSAKRAALADAEDRLAAAKAVIDAAREVLEFLPDDDAAPPGRSAHVDAASKLRKALAAMDAKIGELK